MKKQIAARGKSALHKLKMALSWPWTLAGQARLIVDGERLQLAVTIEDIGTGWIALALEAPNKKYKNVAKAAEGVFKHHGHHVLGEYASVDEAMRASERYASEWMTKNGTAVQARCHCAPIDAVFENPRPGDKSPRPVKVRRAHLPGSKRRR